MIKVNYVPKVVIILGSPAPKKRHLIISHQSTICIYFKEIKKKVTRVDGKDMEFVGDFWVKSILVRKDPSSAKP